MNKYINKYNDYQSVQQNIRSAAEFGTVSRGGNEFRRLPSEVSTNRSTLRGWAAGVRFACLANTLLKDLQSARNNQVLACNFAKYSPILKTFSPTDSAINL